MITGEGTPNQVGRKKKEREIQVQVEAEVKVEKNFRA
jgi:hypothetical protein